MTEKEVSDFLADISAEIENLQKFTNGLNFGQFRENTAVLYACIRSLEIMGEAAKKVDVQFKKRNPQVPWKSMIGMRDILIHGYFKVSTEVVWKTIKEDIPGLKEKMRSLDK